VGFSYPVVPRGQARMQGTACGGPHSEDLAKASESFTKVGKELASSADAAGADFAKVIACEICIAKKPPRISQISHLTAARSGKSVAGLNNAYFGRKESQCGPFCSRSLILLGVCTSGLSLRVGRWRCSTGNAYHRIDELQMGPMRVLLGSGPRVRISGPFTSPVRTNTVEAVGKTPVRFQTGIPPAASVGSAM